MLAKTLSPNLKIVPTDKNVGVSVMTISQYDHLVSQHLNNDTLYKRIHDNELQHTFSTLNTQYQNLQHVLKLTYPSSHHFNVFINKHKAGPFHLPNFHVLPKVHKPIAPNELPPSRPIVGAVNWYTTPWSKLLDVWLSKFDCPNTVSSSAELLIDLENCRFPPNCTLLSIDAVSLYTSIPLEHLKNAVFAAAIATNHPSPSLVVNAFLFVVHNNNFMYNEKVYVQLDGIAMGTNAAVSLANIYLHFTFDVHLQRNPDILYFKRYLDDIVMVIKNDNHDDIKDICRSQWNTLAPGIRWTTEFSSPLPVLDLALTLTPTPNSTLAISSNLFQKPVNVYGYIPWHSAHNRAVFRGFVRAEAHRFQRNCTHEKDFKCAITSFTNRLRSRGYPSKWISALLSDIQHNDRPNQLNIVRQRLHQRRANRTSTTEQSSVNDVIPILIPFSWDERLPALKTLVHQLSEEYWSQSREIKFVTAFQRPPSVYSLFCRSALTVEQRRLLQRAAANTPQ